MPTMGVYCNQPDEPTRSPWRKSNIHRGFKPKKEKK